MAVAIAPVKPAVLTNCEIRGLALRNLALGPRQRSPNPRTMDRPFIFGLLARFRPGLGVRLWFADRIRIAASRCWDNIKQIDRRGQRVPADQWRLAIGDGRTC